jgi:hypothetical protein
VVSFIFLLQRGEAKLLSEDWEGAVQDLKEAAQKSPQVILIGLGVESWWCKQGSRIRWGGKNRSPSIPGFHLILADFSAKSAEFGGNRPIFKNWTQPIPPNRADIL